MRSTNCWLSWFLSKVRFFQRVQGSGISLGPRVRFFPKGPGSSFSLGSGPGPRSLLSMPWNFMQFAECFCFPILQLYSVIGKSERQPRWQLKFFSPQFLNFNINNIKNLVHHHRVSRKYFIMPVLFMDHRL